MLAATHKRPTMIRQFAFAEFILINFPLIENDNDMGDSVVRNGSLFSVIIS